MALRNLGVATERLMVELIKGLWVLNLKELTFRNRQISLFSEVPMMAL